MSEKSSQLEHYLQLWKLSDPQPLAATFSSQVYTVMFEGERVVLKLLKPEGFEEQSGAAALRHFDGHGAARLLNEDENAHLIEYIPGEDLVGMVKQGQDEQATAIIGDVLHQLHSVPVENVPPELPLLSDWFRELYQKASEHRNSGINSLYTRAAAVAAPVLANPRELRVLHGDIHHENIRYHPERGWLAFDPKGLVGERTYDAANTLCNPINMPELVENESRLLRNAAILADKMGIELARVLTFTFMYTCLSASWFASINEDEGEYHALRVGELIEPHLPAIF